MINQSPPMAGFLVSDSILGIESLLRQANLLKILIRLT